MSLGFRIDFAGWDISRHNAKLQAWAKHFFEDYVWLEDARVLLGWLNEPHTVPGVRDVVHHNLTYWQCAKRRRYVKGWVKQLSPVDFRKEAGRAPKPVHDANMRMIGELLLESVVTRSIDLGVRRSAALKRAREETLHCCDRAFKALRRNAPSVQSGAVERAKARLAILESHLQELASLREGAKECFTLPDDWVEIPPGQLHDRLKKRRSGFFSVSFRHSEGTIQTIHRTEAAREATLLAALRAEIEALV